MGSPYLQTDANEFCTVPDPPKLNRDCTTPVFDPAREPLNARCCAVSAPPEAINDNASSDRAFAAFAKLSADPDPGSVPLAANQEFCRASVFYNSSSLLRSCRVSSSASCDS